MHSLIIILIILDFLILLVLLFTSICFVIYYRYMLKNTNLIFDILEIVIKDKLK